MKQTQEWLGLDREALRARLDAWGEPAFRADQLMRWLYKAYEFDPQQMRNLPSSLRQRLAAEAPLNPLTQTHEAVSHDRLARKSLFRLADGETIETVLMLYEERRTVCISTQAGCGMGCPFCATGLGGLARNLTPGEIVAQVLHYARWLAYPDLYPDASVPIARPGHITNIVLMGMGEPLANYAAVWQALALLTDASAFGLGARHITLSTVGLVPGIERMADEPLQIGLAVSLHANDALRDELVPINRRYPLAELMAACHRYVDKTHRRITFEYALMAGINDTVALAYELAQRLRGLLCHVNLIPLNPVAGSPFGATSDVDAEAFAHILRQQGIAATVRLRRGIEINAGCGQLRQAQQAQAVPAAVASGS